MRAGTASRRPRRYPHLHPPPRLGAVIVGVIRTALELREVLSIRADAVDDDDRSLVRSDASAVPSEACTGPGG